MTGEAAVAIHENSIVRDSIYGKRVRTSDMILTGIIYACTVYGVLRKKRGLAKAVLSAA